MSNIVSILGSHQPASDSHQPIILTLKESIFCIIVFFWTQISISQNLRPALNRDSRTCGKHHQLHSCHLVLRSLLPAVACCRRAGRVCHSWGGSQNGRIIFFDNQFISILGYTISEKCVWKKMMIFKTQQRFWGNISPEPGEPKFADLHWWLGLLLRPTGTQRASQPAQREDRLWGAFLSLAKSHQGGECGSAGRHSGQCIWENSSWVPGWCLADLHHPRRRLCRHHLHWHGPLLRTTRDTGRAAARCGTSPWAL